VWQAVLRCCQFQCCHYSKGVEEGPTPPGPRGSGSTGTAESRYQDQAVHARGLVGPEVPTGATTVA
jgi:hypothetical protein